jgi:hypothetical protein
VDDERYAHVYICVCVPRLSHLRAFHGKFSSVTRVVICTQFICLLRGLPHYKQLNFGGGRDWLGANAVVLMGITHAGDKNNVALKSRVFPHNELPLVFP